MGTYKRNSDNVTEAVHGLDIFTKNWCMNCIETKKQNEAIYRCDECEFHNLPNKEDCLIKHFAYGRKSRKEEHNYPMDKFGPDDYVVKTYATEGSEETITDIIDKGWANRIEKECSTGDIECDHLNADRILEDLLKATSLPRTLSAYQKIDKYYA